MNVAARALMLAATFILGNSVGASVVSTKAEGQPGMQVAYRPQRIEGSETLMPGSALYFNCPTRTDPAILVRSVEGEYYAYSCRCSHMGCSVYFERGGRRLECPCHKGSYELQTGFVMSLGKSTQFNQAPHAIPRRTGVIYTA